MSRRREEKEKPIRPEYFQEVIRQSNGFKAERDQARQELKYVLRLLEDIAYGDQQDAREIARKALTKLQHYLEEPLYDQNKYRKTQMPRRVDNPSDSQQIPGHA